MSEPEMRSEPLQRETQKQKLARLSWALQRIAFVTAIPADKRGDLDWLRAACSLAHAYALAGRAPALDDPPERGPPVDAPHDRPT